MSCNGSVLALTPVWAKLSMQPESSDGFASVGTILPKEKAALLPGGFFASEGWVARRIGPRDGDRMLPKSAGLAGGRRWASEERR